jgi:hypothetical protein
MQEAGFADLSASSTLRKDICALRLAAWFLAAQPTATQKKRHLRRAVSSGSVQ